MVTLVISPFLLSPLTLFESSYSKKKFIGIMFHEFWYCENGAIKNPYMIYSIMRPLTDHSAILVKNFPAVGVYLVNFGSRGWHAMIELGGMKEKWMKKYYQYKIISRFRVILLW